MRWRQPPPPWYGALSLQSGCYWESSLFISLLWPWKPAHTDDKYCLRTFPVHSLQHLWISELRCASTLVYSSYLRRGTAAAQDIPCSLLYSGEVWLYLWQSVAASHVDQAGLLQFVGKNQGTCLYLWRFELHSFFNLVCFTCIRWAISSGYIQ